jgi:mono/diheme cytochrome c family protein
MHIPRLREAPVGYFFDVMTRGFGRMPAYAAQVPPADRWAIAAWVRTLQVSQHVELAQLTPAQRQRVLAALAAAAAPAAPPAAPPEGHR